MAIKLARQALVYSTNKTLEGIAEIHHEAIKKDLNVKLRLFDDAMGFIDETRHVKFFVSDTIKKLLNCVRSSLGFYLKEITEVRDNYDVQSYNDEIKTIQELINVDVFVKNDIRANEYDNLILPPRVPTISDKVFISYSSTDKILAGQVKQLLSKYEIDSFLAHHDIEITQEWRNAILRNLQQCSILLALVTSHFMNSVWTNQEVGYFMALGKKVLPLIIDDMDIRRCGFIETFQGIPISKDLNDSIEKIVDFIKS
jgi:hypothetical protein